MLFNYNSHYKIPPEEKFVVALGYSRTLQTLGFPFNISATAEACDFKFDAQLGFAKDHHKITQKKKGAWSWTREAP